MSLSTPNPAQAIPEHRLICRVCEKQYSKYNCPRCNLRSCSLECYKKHSIRCTESFMRENVMEEMRAIKATKESQQSVLEVLKRIHFDEAGRSVFEDESLADEKDDPDESNGTIFTDKTIQLIAEGCEISLDDLSTEERKSFLRAVAAGEISHLIQPWNPWWFNPLARNISITKHGTSLVQPVDPVGTQITKQSRSEEAEVNSGEVPAPPFEVLAPVRQLLRVDPSPLISVSLAEVIYSYCFTLRFCNGDMKSEPCEAASILLSISQVLGEASSPESIEVALAEAVKTLCSPNFKHAGGFKFGVSLCEDCAALLGLGRACVVCALADLHRMLESSKKDLKAELKAEKQEKFKHDSKGELDGNSCSSSNVKEQKYTNSDKSMDVGRNSQGHITHARTFELRKIRDMKRYLKGNCSLPNAIVNVNGSSSRTVDSGHQKHSKQNVELRKIEAAVRKVYFLMCWVNEQPDEVFLSLASLVEVERARLLETTEITNLGISMSNDVKAPISRPGPIVTDAVTSNDVKAPKCRSGPIIEEIWKK